jgi:5-methylcytosine-specific restriction protein A
MNKPCLVPRCPAFAQYRGRCFLHARAYEQRRGTHGQRGYTYQWEIVRRAYLAMYPACVVCGEPATQTDHILPLRMGGTHEVANLRGLCGSCHSKRTIRDDPPRRKKI